MHTRFLALGLAVVCFATAGAVPTHAADNYSIDPMHSGITFKISHLGLCWIQGRFNDFSGNFTIDPDDAGKCSFSLTIKTESVDTNNSKRDGHLRSPDFFNAKQFPVIMFKSTSVKPMKDGGYEVMGELTMHGATKPVKFMLTGGSKAEFPRGVQRTGFTTDLVIKRSDFGVGGEQFGKALGDDVHATISFEGVKK